MQADEAKRYLDSHPATVLIDARKHPGRTQARGAVHYDPGALAKVQELNVPIAADEMVLIYADGGEGERAAEHFRTQGYAKVQVIESAFDEIVVAFGTEEATQEQPLPEVPSSGLHRL